MNAKQVIETIPEQSMKDGLILFGEVGSHAYGTATENSDHDYRGIFIPPPEHYFGVNKTKEYNTPSQQNTYKNNKDDIDVILTPIAMFVQNAMNGHPNNIELLFLKSEEHLHLNKYGKQLIDLRQHFLSKKIGDRFYGYAKSQKLKMLKLKTESEANPDTIDTYGYDTKFYMHAVRLLTSAIDILINQTFVVKHPQAEMLKEIRAGKHDLNQAIENIDHLNDQLIMAHSRSKLPEKPDWPFMNDKLVKITTQFIKDNY